MNDLEEYKMEGRSFISAEKRIFTSTMLHETPPANGTNGKDVTDDVSKNFFKTTKFIHTTASSETTTKQTVVVNDEIKTPTKSFIQQRVERLYGPGALAQGFYVSPRSTKSRETLTNGVLAEKNLNSGNNNFYSSSTLKTELNGTKTTTTTFINLENDENLTATIKKDHSLPVLRHLRPEFRDQLPISPKRSQHQINNLTVTVENGGTDLTNKKSNGISDTSKNSIHQITNGHSQANGIVVETTKMKLTEENNKLNGKEYQNGVSGDSKVENVDKTEVQDGNYFLKILIAEQNRLISLAVKVEEDMEILSVNIKFFFFFVIIFFIIVLFGLSVI